VARRRSTGAAVAVTAIAIAAGVAAGGVVASFDHLLGDPARYGGHGTSSSGNIRTNALDNASLGCARTGGGHGRGLLRRLEIATVDGKNTLLVASTTTSGKPRP